MNTTTKTNKTSLRALKKARELGAEGTIELLKKKGLRGRGGAGFPTGLKWELARRAEGDEKFVVCNADEGEPGTFKDKFIMENSPENIIEGIVIAAYCINASNAYIYLRGEYHYLRERLELKIKEVREGIREMLKDAEEKDVKKDAKKETGLKHIPYISAAKISPPSKSGTPEPADPAALKLSIGTAKWNIEKLNIEIVEGAGAYICGDETAIISSIENKRGYPTFKPPYPPQKGLFGKPTVINNVETMANVPLAILNPEWSDELRLFSLSGDIPKPGVYEIRAGAKLGDIAKLAGAGEGARDKALKAVYFGASGGCIPYSPDFVVSTENVGREGAMLGACSIIFVNKKRSIPDMAINIAEFFKDESCGKCTPCREGTFHILKILLKLKSLKSQNLKSKKSGKLSDKAGRKLSRESEKTGRIESEGIKPEMESEEVESEEVESEKEMESKSSLELLEKLSVFIRDNALCGLGQSCTNHILTALKYFKEEFG